MSYMLPSCTKARILDRDYALAEEFSHSTYHVICRTTNVFAQSFSGVSLRSHVSDMSMATILVHINYLADYLFSFLKPLVTRVCKSLVIRSLYGHAVARRPLGLLLDHFLPPTLLLSRSTLLIFALVSEPSPALHFFRIASHKGIRFISATVEQRPEFRRYTSSGCRV